MKILLNSGDTVGIIACSNGIDRNMEETLKALEEKLKELNLNIIYSKTLYKKFSVFNGSAKERADELMKLFLNPNVKAIFDISGGDLANGVLSYLDFDKIKANPKAFFGYSDLSVLLNGIYTKTSMKTYHYQLRNLVSEYGSKQLLDFKNSLFKGNKDLFNFHYNFIQQNSMEGVLVGGNIRCLLKLAGTSYMPNFSDKILFLESLSGDVAKMTTFLTQYNQLGIFKEIKGLLLGSFTEMENKNYSPSIIELVKNIVNDPNLPIAKTNEIGHSPNSKALIIGDFIKL